MKSRPSDSKDPCCGFTRIELIVIVTTLVLLAVVTRPVWASTGATKSLACMDNLRRLSAAWLLYSDDNGGKFVGNYQGLFLPGPNAKERPWVTGWLDWDLRSDSTNIAYLTNPRYATLAPYVSADATVFKCPADNFLSPAQAAAGWVERVRSYSMSCAIGEGNATSGYWDWSHLQVTGASGFGKNRPQSVFVLLDEHPDSINDGQFTVPDSPWRIVDVPGSHHEGAGWFSFADGHLEERRLQTAKLKRPVLFYYANLPNVPADNLDSHWLLQHTPKR